MTETPDIRTLDRAAPPPHNAPRTRQEELRAGLVPGGAFIFDVPDVPPAVWGTGSQVLWSEGESLVLVGPQGVGKTTLAGQLVCARLGIADQVCGYAVAPGGKKVLYLAMDRPAQVARSMRRLFKPHQRTAVDDRLQIWRGPTKDMAKDPDLLLDLAIEANADTVVVDSLKDAAIGLVDEEVAASYNRGRQQALAEGIQLLELHHMVKKTIGKKRTGLAEVFGSVWLTAGSGSVISLDGDAGDPVVEMRHLKQPAAEVGPLTLVHDHDTGETRVSAGADLVALAAQTPITVLDAAQCMFETSNPTRAEQAKARRRLDGLSDKGLLERIEGRRGGAGGSTGGTWQAPERV